MKPYNNKDKVKPARYYRYLFEIVPSYWNHKKWGDAPTLGFVKADSEFEAVRKAYDRGLVRINFTFEAKAVKVREYPKPVVGV